MSADNASAGPPAAPLANPMHGTAISTSPTQLGLSESRKEKSTMEDEDRDKGIIARTVDKLGRSKSGESKGGSSKLGHRRVFSLSRKNRRKDSLGGSDNGDDSGIQLLPNTDF